MVIKASSGREIDALLTDLASGRAIKRDGAVARLTVIGARAVDRLSALATNRAAAGETRAAAFRALDAIADPRGFDAAVEGLTDADATVATAAAGVVGAFLKTEHGLLALDRLTAMALDTSRPIEVRVAAVQALGDLDPATLTPVLAALRTDPNPAIADAIAMVFGPKQADASPRQCVKDAAAGRLPDDPAVLKEALARVALKAPLAALQQIVEHVRVREGSERSSRRKEWTIVRATAHASLAGRGSRLALYDLRETLETAREPLAVEFLSALSMIGDESCLEPIAAAYDKAAVAGQALDDWWCRSLLDAFRTIVRREGVTRRQAVAKRIERRWPNIVAVLFGGARKSIPQGETASRQRS